MAEEKFDVIIVGGGITGCVAAYLLAQAEMEVLVVERAEEAGQKAVTGGRMYGHAMEKIFPGFGEEAPVERKIVRERISFLAEETATTLEYDDEEMRKPEKASYSILRGNLDPWLTEKAEEAGAMFIHGIRVDKVLTDDKGKAIGVLAGEEEMYADCVWSPNRSRSASRKSSSSVKKRLTSVSASRTERAWHGCLPVTSQTEQSAVVSSIQTRTVSPSVLSRRSKRSATAVSLPEIWWSA